MDTMGLATKANITSASPMKDLGCVQGPRALGLGKAFEWVWGFGSYLWV